MKFTSAHEGLFTGFVLAFSLERWAAALRLPRACRRARRICAKASFFSHMRCLLSRSAAAIVSSSRSCRA